MNERTFTELWLFNNDDAVVLMADVTCLTGNSDGDLALISDFTGLTGMFSSGDFALMSDFTDLTGNPTCFDEDEVLVFNNAGWTNDNCLETSMLTV